MKLIFENWNRFLEQQELNEEAISNIDDHGLLFYPNIENPSYIVIYNLEKASEGIEQYDPEVIEESLKGLLELRFNQSRNAYEVEQIWAVKNYGPTLYRIAIQYATEEGFNGLMPTAIKGQVSNEAKNVWKNFFDGKGKQFVDHIDIPEGRHDEDYLNKIYKAKEGAPVINGMKAIQNNQQIFANDPYGEKIGLFIEEVDSKLRDEMRSIYGQ